MQLNFNLLRQHPDVWNQYTLKEEYSAKVLDQYERFVHTNDAYPRIPDPTVSRFLQENNTRIEYPEDKRFAVCLTHDVDDIYPPFTHTLLSSVTCAKQKKFRDAKNHLFWQAKGKERSPYRNFDRIMNLEEKYGATSSFYFLATESDIRRFRYRVEDTEAELGQILDRGWEVGLHGGYYAYSDTSTISHEKNRLERVLGERVIGYRNHYLRFKVPDTWNNLVAAGFEYDTTLGYPEGIGFRNGTCHPFRPVDLNNGENEIDILEIPLVMMDKILFKKARSVKEALDYSRLLVDAVESVNGVLTLDWHSNNFNCPFRGSFEKIYAAILQYCAEKNGWLTDARSICRWWKEDLV